MFSIDIFLNYSLSLSTKIQIQIQIWAALNVFLKRLVDSRIRMPRNYPLFREIAGATPTAVQKSSVERT